MLSRDALIEKLVAFVESIGLTVQERPLTAPTFLPGVEIRDGGLVIDRERLTYPGDLLHEAGHLAVCLPGVRKTLTGNVMENPGTTDGDELAVMLWTYATCQHLGCAPETVFHSGGYHGQSDWLLEQYRSGNFIGLPLLQWMGMCAREAQEGAPFPHLLRWLRT